MCPCEHTKNMKTRLIFGLKWKRLPEWLRDLKAEGPGVDELWHMTVLACKAIRYPISRQAYIHRMFICHRCPVFNRKLKSCRNGEMGCGCYTPYKALAPVDCWLRESGADLLPSWGKKDPR